VRREEWETAVVEACSRYGVAVPEGAVDRLWTHWLLVREENERQNLTRVPEEAGLRRHVLDSLTLLEWYDGQGTAVDIGSGAGYPGLALACLYPDAEWVLVEARRKRAAFLRHAVAVLGLKRVEVVAERAELAVGARREQCAWAVTRAVGDVGVSAELALPWVALGGWYLAMRGERGRTELAAAAEAVARLGGEVVTVRETAVEGEPRRVVGVIRKVRATPERYPRRGGALGRF
jgi:16S rRNA (guanine527-N7)-methyltransferase